MIRFQVRLTVIVILFLLVLLKGEILYPQHVNRQDFPGKSSKKETILPGGLSKLSKISYNQSGKNITQKKRISIEDVCYSFDVKDNLLYYGRDLFFEIADVSDPVSPNIFSSTAVPSAPFDIVVGGDYAYVSLGHHGIYVFDISKPESPVNICMLTEIKSGDLYISGDLLLTIWYSEIEIIDISQPDNIKVMGGFPGYRVAINGSTVYTSLKETDSLVVYDISDPYAPEVDSNINLGGYNFASTVNDSVLYILTSFIGGSSLNIYNITVPQVPVKIDSLNFEHDRYAEIIVSDNIGYIIDYIGQKVYLNTIDLSSFSNPITLSRNEIAKGGLRKMVLENNLLYILTRTEIQVIDVSDPSGPSKLTELQTFEERVTSIAVSGDFAFLSFPLNTSSSKILVYDISESGNPVLVNDQTFEFGGEFYSWESHLNSNNLFLVGIDSFVIIDISNPYSLKEIGSYDLISDNTFSLFTNDKYAVIGRMYGERFVILDITDPYFPMAVGSLHHPNAGWGFSVSSNYIYFGEDALNIYNIIDPSNPIGAGSYETDFPVRGICVSGDYMYVTSQYKLHIFDISNPDNTFKISSMDISYSNYRLYVKDNYVYVPSGFDMGLSIIDVSDPDIPVNAVNYSSGFWVRNIDFSDNYFFTSDGYGFEILSFKPDTAINGPVSNIPENFILHDNYPNPFNNGTTIKFSIKNTAFTTLKIYNLMGQHIKTLISKALEPENYTYYWGGKNDKGQKVGSGVYLYRLQVGNFSQTKKMLLIK